MAKKPAKDMSTYSKPANLPGFLAEFMLPPLRGFSLRYGGGFQKVTPRAKAGGVHSARAGGKAGLFPELLPLPDAGSFVEDGVAELVGQHQNLTAMMRLVREHVSEHGASGGPRWHPTVAGEFRDAAIMLAGERNRMIYSSRRM